MSTLFEQKVLDEFVDIHEEFVGIREELSDVKIGLAETTKAVELNREAILENRAAIEGNREAILENRAAIKLNREAIEVNREQIGVNTQKIDAHSVEMVSFEERQDRLILTVIEIQETVRRHDEEFVFMRQSFATMFEKFDEFLGVKRHLQTEITALGSARDRHEGRIERLETHTGLAV